MQIRVECAAVALPRSAMLCNLRAAPPLGTHPSSPPAGFEGDFNTPGWHAAASGPQSGFVSSACDMPRAFLITHRRYIHPADQHKGETKGDAANSYFLLRITFSQIKSSFPYFPRTLMSETLLFQLKINE
jgi:hypothetical protein